LLDDAFTIEPDLPEDLKSLVRKLDLKTAPPPAPAGHGG
jgi:hypothetical protein